MKFGVIGLRRMGGNIARQALEKGHDVVGFNRTVSVTKDLAAHGLKPARSLKDLVVKLPHPRIIFIYVTHGEATESICVTLRPLLAARDIIIDGGNSHWLDSKRRYGFFAENGIRFLDIGTSGGVSGARHGACFMAGGDREAFDIVSPILGDLAVSDKAVLYAGAAGAGHFTKLIHNAIEFSMVQALAEGVELLKRSDYEIDLPGLFTNWSHGSVIRSWLVELMAQALQQHPNLKELATYVEDTGEVKWVLEWAMKQDIPTPVVAAAQTALMQYRDLDYPAAKAVALLRNAFGEHPVHRKDHA